MRAACGAGGDLRGSLLSGPMLPKPHARPPKARAAHAGEGRRPGGRRLCPGTLGSLPVEPRSVLGTAVSLRVQVRGAPRPPVRLGGPEVSGKWPFCSAQGTLGRPKLWWWGAGRSAPDTPGGAPRPKSTISPPRRRANRGQPGEPKEHPGMRTSSAGTIATESRRPPPARATCCVTLDGIRTSEPLLLLL